MTDQPRQPAGAPDGGQFAATTGAESAGLLVASVTTEATTRVTPHSPLWPAALKDLGPDAPKELYVRGNVELLARWSDSVAIDGSRASSAYGEHVAAELAADLAERDIPMMTGAAYGIDGAAIRANQNGPQIMVFAGGLDRVYPAGHNDLVQRVRDNGGLAASTEPDGAAATRDRFLRRKDIMATAGATLIVEAAAQSGALRTARTAASLGRPVGAVPGPVMSSGSVGCHELIRSGAARIVTRLDDIAPAVSE